MSYIRKITKIKDFVASCILWNTPDKRTEKAPLYFMDGIIGINSEESVMIGVNEPTLFGFNIGEYKKLRTTYGLKDGDVFVGRGRNYALFRNGNLTMKGGTLRLEYNALEVVANSLNFNGVVLKVVDGKLLINNKEIAVVGGDINTGTNKITGSGQ